MKFNGKFYSFDEHTIIASNNQSEAEELYKEDYDSEFEKVVELPFDTVIDFKSYPNNDGYIEVLLIGIVDKYKDLPFVVNTGDYELYEDE